MFLIFDKNKKYLQCLSALFLLGRSNPDHNIIKNNVSLLNYNSFNKSIFKSIYSSFDKEYMSLYIKETFIRQSPKINYIKIIEIQKHIDILIKYINDGDFELAKRLMYAMHKLPEAIFISNIKMFDLIIESELFRSCILGTINKDENYWIEKFFIIEDEGHSEKLDRFPTFDDALNKMKIIKNIPWNKEPNKCPCAQWKTCKREYKIAEYEIIDGKWKLLKKTDIFDISSIGIDWKFEKNG